MRLYGRNPGTLGAAILLAVAGCNAFLPTRETPAEGELPESFSLGHEMGADQHHWWNDFESQALDRLVDEAMDSNLTLRQLWARLDQANSVAVQSASGLWPQLDYTSDASYTRTVVNVDADRPSFKSQIRDAVLSGAARGLNNSLRRLGDESGGQTGGSSLGSLGTSSSANEVDRRVVTESKRFALALAASYELDIWGRIANQYRAAREDVTATRDELEATAITLAAEVTDRWLTILEQQELLRLFDEQLETNRTYLELVELRFRKGQVSALDVYQQRQTVSEVRRQIPLAEAREQVARQELAVLLGKPPTSELAVGSYDLQHVPELPATGIPAELLVNRPDVRAGMARLQAADYRVASARADLLPALRLTGGIGYSTTEIRHLFDDWFVSVAAGLTGPIFDGFRRTAEIERTLAVVEERLADYRLTVLIAIQEVEQALIQESKQREYLQALNEQLEDARNTLREALERYRKGLNDYLPVLTALERTQALTRTIVTARRDLLSIRVGLYRALGGTWTSDLQQPVRLSDQVTATGESAS